MPLLDLIPNPWLDALVGLVVMVLVMTLAVLFLIWYERKLIGRLQQRLGPMRTGPYGLLQTIADAIKLVGKEDVRPATADRWVFEFAVFAIFVPAFLTFIALPFTRDWAISFMRLSLIYVLAVSGLSFIGLLMAGWGSDNKYALLGGMRAAAQLISYEIPIILAALAVVIVTGTADLVDIVTWQGRVPLIVWQPLAFFIFFVASLSELERQPFDIPTAESEVVGGPFIEYSGIRWSMFQLTAYANLLSYSVLASLLFFGGWDWPLGREWGLWWQTILIVGKTLFFISVFMWVRGTFPRLRVDQLMAYCWKALIPLGFLQIFLNGLVVVYDWPDWAHLLTSGGGLALAFYIAYAAVRVKEARPLAVARSAA
ncbi:MAG TPA: NADH-quinone oxidoreductase subunit NuoH [Dehalococcoidia bacterium]|nr:NADH-quinone oxidoreductase subunit NuoH [Dehalococcoidia bacterium]